MSEARRGFRHPVRVAFVIGDYPEEEFRRRERAALAYASPEVEIGIVRTPATPFVHGLTPAEVQLVAPGFIAAFREAERQGYDAVVPLGTLDLGVDGGRSVVDIPVIAPTESMLRVAGFLGDRFGALVYHDDLIPLLRAIVRRYGMEDQVVGWRASGFDLPDLSANLSAMTENFVDGARRLVRESGCDVILAMGVTQCPVLLDPAWVEREVGVPVVEGIGAPLRVAAMLAGLGLRHSRVRWRRSRAFERLDAAAGTGKGTNA
ncbi:aspartate/glutamate racemase family protein [Muricoccus radiodurans]|uniref:aspartate/glutamate racemase family protein n=1 Tax=Muricoccus radiodurans TaxID=2231721 RepID=UPI003CF750F1